jgi:hypothetical protein
MCKKKKKKGVTPPAQDDAFLEQFDIDFRPEALLMKKRSEKLMARRHTDRSG